MTDEKLLQQTSRGDEAAFLTLYERHRATLFRFAYRMLGSAAVAEELTHDCFLSLVRWEAPTPSANAGERLLADFRAARGRAPLWRRALAAQLRVPLPVAACALLALLTVSALAALAWNGPAHAESKAFETAPQLVGDGDAFALDVLQNPRTGAKIVDVTKSHEENPRTFVFFFVSFRVASWINVFPPLTLELALTSKGEVRR